MNTTRDCTYRRKRIRTFPRKLTSMVLPILFLLTGVSCADKKRDVPSVSNNDGRGASFQKMGSGLTTVTDRKAPQKPERIEKTALVLLGTFQDAGSPQIGCKKECCAALFDTPDERRKVISLGLVDAENHKTYLFEATPDIGSQMEMLTRLEAHSTRKQADGIFLTHAHIGHYTGLMYLGKEALNAHNTPVYTMPRMRDYLSGNGPWSQLVQDGNIELRPLEDGKAVTLSTTIRVTPIQVPHRDEYSETVGYRIEGPEKSALFIPDIDKWDRWGKSITAEIQKVDYAFLDATFYSGKELDNRDMRDIPHPSIRESLKTFAGMSRADKAKVIFIHFNHTNPVVRAGSDERKFVTDQGFRLGAYGDVFEL